jgi:glycosyltransferase involved in cell wall biosynthesis
MRLGGHTHFVTVADAIGEPTNSIPTCGRKWLPTLPPVVLDEWPVATGPTRNALTTVGHWRSYGSIHHDGVQYGQKVHSLRPLIDLPSRTRSRFELALAIHPDESADLKALADNDWALLDPGEVARTPDDYRRFVQGSWAEFGLAKSGYAVSDSGWFSDRSACYLASGRPVIAQDTGFGRRLPTGEGLFAFASADDVLAAIDALEDDYERHREAAREIAVAHLDSDRVLGSLLERVTA